MVDDGRNCLEPSCRPNRIELKDLRADEDAILTSYGWIDPNKGIVRIPIDQAIDIVAQKEERAVEAESGGTG